MSKVRTVTVSGPGTSVSWGPGAPLALIAGPCVIESRAHCLGIARKLAALASRLGIPLVFKASFDKANRSSIDSYRGPGLEKALRSFQRSATKRAYRSSRTYTSRGRRTSRPWQASTCFRYPRSSAARRTFSSRPVAPAAP